MVDRICTVEGCGKKHVGHGYCDKHLTRLHKYGTTDPTRAYNDDSSRRPKPEVCEIDGCDRPANVPGTGRGWCQAHYRRWQNWGDVHAPPRKAYSRIGDTCEVCGVVLTSSCGGAHGLCKLHYRRLYFTGSTDDPIPYERPICSEPNCGDGATGRGLCPRHYGQRYRPDRFDRLKKKLAEKFTAEELAEQARHNAKRRRAVLRGAKEHHTHAEWMAKLAEYGDRCAYCGASADTKDHDVPLARGGSDAIGNIVPACRSCNSRKYTRTADEWRAILAEGQDDGEEEDPGTEYQSA